jgi:hypothetical protein
MTRKLTAFRTGVSGSKLYTRPAAASGMTDSESGVDPGTTEQDLYALKVMCDRGLMSREEYERRRAEILTGSGVS